MLGGARSGKSEVAETLVRQVVATRGLPVTYVATGGTDDAGMAERIAAHRARRPMEWTTIEVSEATPGGLVAAVAGPPGVVLVDSLGTWLATQPGFEFGEDVVQALTDRAGPTFAVSDEVGLGVHPSTEAGRLFRDALGLLNRRLAGRAERAVLIVAGRILELGPPGVG